jgi:glutathione S-transferase
MPEPRIIGAPQSPFVRVTRMALREKGVAYALDPARPHTQEVDAIHPLGKIPVFRYGDVALAESRAICLYVDRVFDGPGLVPSDPVGAARAEQWISIVITATYPVVLSYLAAYFFPGTADGSPNRPAIEAALPKMEPQFAMLDRAVAASGHLAGDTFTLADMYLMAILYWARQMPESGAMLAKTAHLPSYYERHQGRPSVAETVPPPMPAPGRS